MSEPAVGLIHATPLAIPPVREAFVLGQASMARVLPTLPPKLAAKTLTSPTLAVETARRAIG